MSYDPELRRDTPLAEKIKQRINTGGPVTLDEYMTTCLYDPDHGYYRVQRVIGADGDFVTAPEISQVFGELAGLWCAVVWQQMGRPKPFNFVEFGPGRGTMMRDVLRAVRIVPGFCEAARIALIESSEALREVQKETLRDSQSPIAWFKLSLDVPRGPTIVLANEYLDAVPVNQWRFSPVLPDGGEPDEARRLRALNWEILCVSLDAQDRLTFQWLPAEMKEFELLFDFLGPGWAAATAGLKAGDILEWRNTPISEFGCEFSGLLEDGGAALVIDYGHAKTAPGDSLQAVRHHGLEHPLTSPGEADLTTHVNFEEFQQSVARGYEAAVFDGPIPQGEFLGRLGIIERASKLMGANPSKAGEIEAGVMRLMAPNGMGTRFKAMGIRSPNVGKLPGF